MAPQQMVAQRQQLSAIPYNVSTIVAVFGDSGGSAEAISVCPVGYYGSNCFNASQPRECSSGFLRLNSSDFSSPCLAWYALGGHGAQAVAGRLHDHFPLCSQRMMSCRT
jgi:hypothetical protein